MNYNKTYIHLAQRLTTILSGLLVMASLNCMMLGYNYDKWTNTRYGAWSVFAKHFEISGFDPLTYITITKWRPLYELPRHPLLSAMMWPLSQLNDWLRDMTGMNCTIYIVAVVWTVVSLCSWLLLYAILRRLLRMTWGVSLLLIFFFFSFSHIMLTVFTPDHMTLSQPIILLGLYLSGRAMDRGRSMPLWQSLPLVFIGTGITTTNVVKTGLADLASQWGRRSWRALCRHFAAYLIPLTLIGGAYFWQEQTVMVDERASNNALMKRKMQSNPEFARKQREYERDKQKRDAAQLVQSRLVTNTEYTIDRWPSLSENIFGEGLILHTTHTLRDSNRERPVLVRYTHWGYYVLEAAIVALFMAGVWAGRRHRLLLAALGMFLFDMLLHVGLNFASADAYIMTAHWAFVIPMAVACLIGHLSPEHAQEGFISRHCRVLRRGVIGLTALLTLLLWAHNLPVIVHYILG